MSSPRGASKTSHAKAADAAAAASWAEKPRPLPLPPGVSFESLRGRLKKSSTPSPWEEENKNDRATGSVSSRVEAINQRIQSNTTDAAKTELNAVRFKVRFAPRVAKSEDVQAKSKPEAAAGGSASAADLSSSAKLSRGAPLPRGDDPVNDSEDCEDLPSPLVETIPIERNTSNDDGISSDTEAADVDKAWERPTFLEQTYTEASLLQLCQLSPPKEEGEQPQPSEEALVEKITRLLPDPEAYCQEVDELFSACTAQSGNATLSSQELYDLTQRLIDLFGSRDTDVLERISLIYSSVEQACGPESGIGVVELRGYVASVLTQILHELESREEASQSMKYIPSPSRESTCNLPGISRESSCMLPTTALEPEWQPEPRSAASPGLADVFAWMPGSARQKSEQAAETGGGAFDLVRHSWASLRGSVASLASLDVFQGGAASKDKEATQVQGAAVSDDANAAVQSCVARGIVETAQDISPPNSEVGLGGQGARGHWNHESPG